MPPHASLIRSIGQQAAIDHGIAPFPYRREAAPRCQRVDAGSVDIRHRPRKDDEASACSLCMAAKVSSSSPTSCTRSAWSCTPSPGATPCISCKAGPLIDIAGSTSTATCASPWHRLFEQLQPLPSQFGTVCGEPRDVPVRPRDVGNQSRSHGIPTCEDDREALRGLAGGAAAGTFPATIRATGSRTSSAARSGSRSGCPSAQRSSRTMALHIAEGVQPL